MKWVCVIALVLDLLLVAGAVFRVMTVPKKDVVAVEDTIIGAIEKGGEFLESAMPLAEEWDTGDDQAEWGEDAAADEGQDGQDGIDYKNIELDEDTLENYDDQAEKGKALDSAKDEIGKRFGSK